jgi:hypothetical protein
MQAGVLSPQLRPGFMSHLLDQVALRVLLVLDTHLQTNTSWYMTPPQMKLDIQQIRFLVLLAQLEQLAQRVKPA